MSKNITKFTIDKRNFYLCDSTIEDNILLNLMHKNVEFRILFVSKDFSLYSIKKTEENIEHIISQNWLIEISFFWLWANQLERIADNKIVNLWTEQNEDWILSIITTSEDNIKDDWFLYAFIDGWSSTKDENGYIRENFIIYDDNNLLEYITRLIS